MPLVRIAKLDGTDPDPLGLHDIADAAYDKVRDAIRDALASLAGQQVDELAIHTTFTQVLTNLLTDIVTATASSPAEAFGIAFNDINIEAVRWAEQHTGKLITGITEESKRAVRASLTETIRLGAEPDLALIADTVGLTERQATTLARYTASFDDPVFGARQTVKRHKKMLRQRAELIARTESLQASNIGQETTWQIAQDRGLIPRTSQKRIIITQDLRVCPICIEAEGQQASIGSQFNIATKFKDGEPVNYEPIRVPPLHPACRCALVLVEV